MSRLGGTLWVLGLALGFVAPTLRAEDWPGVFDPLQLLTLNLELDERDWDTIRHDQTYEIEVPAMFNADGENPILVSVRRKSATGLPNDNNPVKVSLKIDINEYVDDQLWRDLAKVSLENGDDVNVLAEGLAWNLHRMASGPEGYGYAAGYASWVRLNVNGQYVGLYVNAEQRDKQMLKNRGMYISGQTWLYEIDDVGSYELEVGEGSSPAFDALCYPPFQPKRRKSEGGCRTPDDATLEADLTYWIDMDGMLALGAVNAFTANPDELINKGKNYFFADYLQLQWKRSHFPWDLDAVFRQTDSPIYATRVGGRRVRQSPYQETILNHPTFRTQFNRIMTDLLDGPMSEGEIIAFLNTVEPIITPSLEEDSNNNLSDSVPEAFDNLREWIRRRVANVRQQVAENNQPPPRG